MPCRGSIPGVHGWSDWPVGVEEVCGGDGLTVGELAAAGEFAGLAALVGAEAGLLGQADGEGFGVATGGALVDSPVASPASAGAEQSASCTKYVIP